MRISSRLFIGSWLLRHGGPAQLLWKDPRHPRLNPVFFLRTSSKSSKSSKFSNINHPSNDWYQSPRGSNWCWGRYNWTFPFDNLEMKTQNWLLLKLHVEWTTALLSLLFWTCLLNKEYLCLESLTGHRNQMRYINFLSSCPEFVCLISSLFLLYIFSIIWPLFPKLPKSSEKYYFEQWCW